MSDESLQVRPLSAESVADTLGFTQAEADKVVGEAPDDALDQRFVEAADKLMRMYTPAELDTFLSTIVDGGEYDDKPEQFTSVDGKVFTVDMAKYLHAIVQRELE